MGDGGEEELGWGTGICRRGFGSQMTCSLEISCPLGSPYTSGEGDDFNKESTRNIRSVRVSWLKQEEFSFPGRSKQGKIWRWEVEMKVMAR